MSDNVLTGSRPFTHASIPSSSTVIDRAVLRRVRDSVRSAPVAFTLWDGYECPPAEPPVATVRFRTRPALYATAWDPALYFGEGYTAGTIEVRGDLLGALEALYRALPPSDGRPPRQPLNGVVASRRNVHHHYDIGNAFYRLWLDEALQYTCAYFPTADASLEEAQRAKMELVCRKLALAPGERVVEAGCGWGTFALYMARHHGVTVRAYNISTEQIAFARERAARDGLADRVEFIEDDYRNATGRCEAFVSVGMLEHVGAAAYPVLGRVIDRLIGTDGRGFLHFIGRNRPERLNPWITRRIFPGAYPPTLREVLTGVLEPNGFSVLDVENLRLHYAKTLDHWRRRYERASAVIARMFDEPFVRAWRLYLTGSEASFSTGSLQLFQVVFARGTTNALPWTRCRGVDAGALE